MRVQDVMTEGVRTIATTASAEEARSQMRLHGVHHLVATRANRVVGVLSARDLGRSRVSASAPTSTVADLMSAPPVTVEPATTIRQAANVMRGRSIGCLVVVESGRLVGIVTVSDLLELVGRGLDRGVVTTTRWTLNHRAPHRKSRGAVRAW